MARRRWKSWGAALAGLSTKSTRCVQDARKCSVWGSGGGSPGETGGEKVTRGYGAETHGYGGFLRSGGSVTWGYGAASLTHRDR